MFKIITSLIVFLINFNLIGTNYRVPGDSDISGYNSSLNRDCVEKMEAVVSSARFAPFSNSVHKKEEEEKVIDNSNIKILNWSTWLRFFEGLFLFLLVEISFFVPITEHATRLLLIMVPLVAAVYLNKTGTRILRKNESEDSYRVITPLNIWFLSIFVFIVCGFIEYLVAFYSVQRIKEEVDRKRKSFKGFVTDDEDDFGHDASGFDPNRFNTEFNEPASNVKQIIEEDGEKKKSEEVKTSDVKEINGKLEDKKDKDGKNKKDIVVPEPKADPKQEEVQPRVVITDSKAVVEEAVKKETEKVETAKKEAAAEAEKKLETNPDEASKLSRTVSFIQTEKPEKEASKDLPPPSVIEKKPSLTAFPREPIELEDGEEESDEAKKNMKKKDESPSMIHLATIRKKKRQEKMEKAFKKVNQKLHLLYTISYLPADKTARLTFPICFLIYCYFFWLVYIM